VRPQNDQKSRHANTTKSCRNASMPHIVWAQEAKAARPMESEQPGVEMYETLYLKETNFTKTSYNKKTPHQVIT